MPWKLKRLMGPRSYLGSLQRSFEIGIATAGKNSEFARLFFNTPLKFINFVVNVSIN